jgi:hypothetical protein
MRYLKILSFFFLFSIIFIQCTENQNFNYGAENKTIELRNQNLIGNSCLEDNLPPNTGSCIFGIIPLIIEIPAYPNCQFYIEVETYHCYGGGGNNSLFVGDFRFTQPIDCPDYFIDYNNAVNTNTLPAFELNFNTSIWFAAQDKLVTNFGSSITNGVLTITYVVGSCSYTCYEIGEPNPKRFSTILPVSYNCGENCCKVTRGFEFVNGIPTAGPPIIDIPNEECEDTNVRCVSGGAPKCSGGCDELIGF